MSTQRVTVGLGDTGYEIVVGPGLLDRSGELLASVSTARRIALITDSSVGELYGPKVSALLASAGFEVHALSFAAGETSKTWAVAGQLLEAMAHDGIERGDLVVALGGGVVGDMAGFVAATYLRGIDFAQIPTTMLAQVDSSIGGKTGVDLEAGKNLAGAFKQPLLVISDTDALTTLSDVEWRSGLAEVAKSAIIGGEEFLGWLEENSGLLMARDPATCEQAVLRSAAFKAGVVSVDERESGVRECLNYGHTLGHAIEKVAGYGVIPHGLAVAEGIRFAARLAVECANGTREFVARQDAILDALGLPSLPQRFEVGDIGTALRADKKVRGGMTRWVLVDEPGVWRCESVEESTMMEHIQAWAASKAGE